MNTWSCEWETGKHSTRHADPDTNLFWHQILNEDLIFNNSDISQFLFYLTFVEHPYIFFFLEMGLQSDVYSSTLHTTDSFS